jgi:hypothetical protein
MADEPAAPEAKKIPAPNYLKIVCHDTVWMKAIFAILQRKFGYGQSVQQYDAYMLCSPKGDPIFFLNRETIPMDQVARLVGTTPDALAGMAELTLKALPFDKALPEPNGWWGEA